MALRKKGSRVISIDNEKYRWVISPNDGYNVFVAEKEGVKGCKIEAYFETDINQYCVNFPYVQNLNLKILTPKDAELIIREALTFGWDPYSKGGPITFDFKENKLMKKNEVVQIKNE